MINDLLLNYIQGKCFDKIYNLWIEKPASFVRMGGSIWSTKVQDTSGPAEPYVSPRWGKLSAATLQVSTGWVLSCRRRESGFRLFNVLSLLSYWTELRNICGNKKKDVKLVWKLDAKVERRASTDNWLHVCSVFLLFPICCRTFMPLNASKHDSQSTFLVVVVVCTSLWHGGIPNVEPSASVHWSATLWCFR